MLRKLDYKDAQRMLEWMHDPNVNCNFRADFNKMTENDVRRFIENSFSETNQNFAFTNQDDEYLGTISLKNISMTDLSAEYAIVTRSDAQGTGYAMEATMSLLRYAFHELGLHRVYLNVLEKNTRANRFYLKCGFSFEGTFKDHLRLHGTFENLNWYGMLKDRFSKLTGIPFLPFDAFLRPASAADACTLSGLEYAPETEGSSSEKPSGEDHINRLSTELKSKNRKIYILSSGLEKIGTICLDYDETQKAFSVTYRINPQFHSEDCGTKILSLIESEIRKQKKTDAAYIIGKVHQSDSSGMLCFKKSGYHLSEDHAAYKTFCKTL